MTTTNFVVKRRISMLKHVYPNVNIHKIAAYLREVGGVDFVSDPSPDSAEKASESREAGITEWYTKQGELVLTNVFNNRTLDSLSLVPQQYMKVGEKHFKGD